MNEDDRKKLPKIDELSKRTPALSESEHIRVMREGGVPSDRTVDAALNAMKEYNKKKKLKES